MLVCMFVVLVQVREIVCICLHVCTYESVCTCVRMHICENSLVNVYVSASMRACVCVYVRLHENVHLQRQKIIAHFEE